MDIRLFDRRLFRPKAETAAGFGSGTRLAGIKRRERTITYTIRNYIQEDAEQIGAFAKLLELAYRYNRDFEPANIFCAVNGEGRIGAVGHLEPSESFAFIASDAKPADYVYRLSLDTAFNDEVPVPADVESRLIDRLLERAREMKAPYPGKRLRVCRYFRADDVEDIDLYLSKGFLHYDSHHIMRRDLNEPIPEYALPEGVRVRHWTMDTPEEQLQYQRAESLAGEGDPRHEAWTLNRLRWYKAGPEWDTFTAFADGQPIGSVMTWGISPSRSATENIFVVPAWRRQRIASHLIAHAMRFVQARGKSEVTLGVYGDNKRAIALYKSMGYKLIYINMGYGFDV
ncbi:GNAT family N-acetyltransferase [Paenibacillus ginsengarvi]|uniref:GNAT family N-acetyltransferase n=1 Tax=Paenibacillus ginsengarvi TaxID=400777 RepID=A0A3B0AX33_9BACL|nr:GNAT family N-acetyltransferase [Paenibacillus ginsengarvi]RKN64894.1 GNAT family N-acetyltransferase [Paenibacillus ginsengarvi]